MCMSLCRQFLIFVMGVIVNLKQLADWESDMMQEMAQYQDWY